MPISVVQALIDENFNNDIKLIIGYTEMESAIVAFAFDVIRGFAERFVPTLPTYVGLSATTVYNDLKNQFINDDSIGT